MDPNLNKTIQLLNYNPRPFFRILSVNDFLKITKLLSYLTLLSTLLISIYLTKDLYFKQKCKIDQIKVSIHDKIEGLEFLDLDVKEYENKVETTTVPTTTILERTTKKGKDHDLVLKDSLAMAMRFSGADTSDKYYEEEDQGPQATVLDTVGRIENDTNTGYFN